MNYSEDKIPTIREIKEYLNNMEKIQVSEDEVRRAILATISEWGKDEEGNYTCSCRMLFTNLIGPSDFRRIVAYFRGNQGRGNQGSP